MNFDFLVPYLDYSIFVLLGLYLSIQLFYTLGSKLAMDSADYDKALSKLWDNPDDEELKLECFIQGMHYYYEMDSSASYILNGFEEDYLSHPIIDFNDIDPFLLEKQYFNLVLKDIDQRMYYKKVAN